MLVSVVPSWLFVGQSNGHAAALVHFGASEPCGGWFGSDLRSPWPDVLSPAVAKGIKTRAV